mmetsp:Transcript_66656/g.138959  ORF Transcript_66656/g.138959 Transcript_66656/m.138959 type:complete len:348 (-) Transcript_66656:71-1114(-)
MMHTNWMVGTETKLKSLKEKGLWLLGAEGACDLTYASKMKTLELPAGAARTAAASKEVAVVAPAAEVAVASKEPATLDEMSQVVLHMAKEMTEKGGWVLLILANKAFAELTQNWICNLRGLGLEKRLEQTLFVAIDQPTYDQLEGYQRVKWFSAGQGDLKYDTKPYYELMHKRTVLILDLLKQKSKIFLCETDQIWYSDPVAYVEKNHPSADIVTYDDGKGQKEKLPCGGFLFLNPTQHTIKLWGTLVEKHKKQMGNEQMLLKGLLPKKPEGMKLEWLPSDKFRNGRWYVDGFGGKPNPKKVVMMHTNWMIGTAIKVKTLKEKGLWFLTDKGACRVEYAGNPVIKGR